MNKKSKALLITKTAKKNQFIDCEIEGVENRGKKNKFIRSKIYSKIYRFKKSHPKKWHSIIMVFILPVIIGIILLLVEYNFFQE
ncbi:hypothetical protein CL633_01805 [bacterium]|nr:hypothetical protein [bacterium]|tara:strand:- start:2743 stop:2994 length:252 start_codon:yes stop_codon:yes gene_type:complete